MSNLACCAEAALKEHLLEYLCTQITRIASDSVLSLELAVMAAYSIASGFFFV